MSKRSSGGRIRNYAQVQAAKARRITAKGEANCKPPIPDTPADEPAKVDPYTRMLKKLDTDRAKRGDKA